MKKCRVCRLGLFDEAGPYIVPLDLGYAVREGHYTLYCHSAHEGRKIEAIRQNPRVAFEMDCAAEVYAADAETPCTYSCRFESVMGEGRARLLETHADKAAGLNAIMRQQAGREFAFSEAMTAVVAFNFPKRWNSWVPRMTLARPKTMVPVPMEISKKACF